MTFLYKCRACGVIERNPHIGMDDESGHMRAVTELVNAINGSPVECMSPTMFSIHSCGDKRTGISDLIGCAPDANPS